MEAWVMRSDSFFSSQLKDIGSFLQIKQKQIPHVEVKVSIFTEQLGGCDEDPQLSWA